MVKIVRPFSIVINDYYKRGPTPGNLLREGVTQDASLTLETYKGQMNLNTAVEDVVQAKKLIEGLTKYIAEMEKESRDNG